MAERKTSAEIEREKATEGALDNLLDGAFADANTMKKTGPTRSQILQPDLGRKSNFPTCH